jgi:hypothetical protein
MKIADVKYPGMMRLGGIVMSGTTYNPKSGTVKRQAHPDVMVIEYDPTITLADHKHESSRVYWVVVDGEIIKIGGSNAKNGITGTISAYLGGTKDSGRGPGKGNSPRTYSVSKYMLECLKAGQKVEIYFANLPQTTLPVYNSRGQVISTQPVSAAFHDFEKALVDEHKNLEGKYPFLNPQEASEKWLDIKHPITGVSLVEGHAGL